MVPAGGGGEGLGDEGEGGVELDVEAEKFGGFVAGGEDDFFSADGEAGIGAEGDTGIIGKVLDGGGFGEEGKAAAVGVDEELSGELIGVYFEGQRGEEGGGAGEREALGDLGRGEEFEGNTAGLAGLPLLFEVGGFMGMGGEEETFFGG